MNMLSRLADRLVLQPTTEAIDPEIRQCQIVNAAVGQIEMWTNEAGNHSDSSEFRDLLDPPKFFDQVAIKFPGTGGRAERGGPHPFELSPRKRTLIYTVNHAGYGGSHGTASLQNFPTTCDDVWKHVVDQHPGIPIWLIGNSLGCVSALYLAARHPAAGVYLRNPVPIHQLIAMRRRYNWWSFGMAKKIAAQIPSVLDAVENASQSTCPAMIVRSANDRIVPGKYQRMIFDAYAGEKSEFVLTGVDHHEGIPESQVKDYIRFVQQHAISIPQ